MTAPDWLYHHLTLAGAAPDLAAFRTAAAGAGVIPWEDDLAPAAEDWFHLLVAPPPPQRRSLSLDGARILSGQLRDATIARQRRIAAAAPHHRGCPFDLHRLLPVPAPLLRRGPDDPATLAWLRDHWGTTRALRGVVVLKAPPGQLRLGFWSADWSPWQALLALRAAWPALRFDLRPLYADP